MENRPEGLTKDELLAHFARQPDARDLIRLRETDGGHRYWHRDCGNEKPADTGAAYERMVNTFTDSRWEPAEPFKDGKWDFKDTGTGGKYLLRWRPAAITAGTRVRGRSTGRNGTVTEVRAGPRYHIRWDTAETSVEGAGILIVTCSRPWSFIHPGDTVYSLRTGKRGTARRHGNDGCDGRPRTWVVDFDDGTSCGVPEDELSETKPAEGNKPAEPEKEGQMKNGTYSVKRLIEKCDAELKANTEALAKAKAAADARKMCVDVLREVVKNSQKNAQADTAAIIKAVTMDFTGPDVTDNTARLAGIGRALAALGTDTVDWNEDVEFVLRDFSGANGASMKTVTVVVDAPKE